MHEICRISIKCCLCRFISCEFETELLYHYLTKKRMKFFIQLCEKPIIDCHFTCNFQSIALKLTFKCHTCLSHTINVFLKFIFD